jgi:hypothetical protein
LTPCFTDVYHRRPRFCCWSESAGCMQPSPLVALLLERIRCAQPLSRAGGPASTAAAAPASAQSCCFVAKAVMMRHYTLDWSKPACLRRRCPPHHPSQPGLAESHRVVEQGLAPRRLGRLGPDPVPCRACCCAELVFFYMPAGLELPHYHKRTLSQAKKTKKTLI